MFNIALPSFGRTTSSVGAIGLDICLEYIHMVQLQMVNGEVRLHATASQPLQASFEEYLKQPIELQNLLKTALKNGAFTGKQTVTSMPSTMTRVMSVNYDVRNGQNDGEAIIKLLVDRIGDDLSDFVVDYMPINQDHRVSERAALIALCRKDTVNSYLQLLSKAGLIPTALEIGPVAIKRLVDSLQHRRPTSSSLVVNCGRERSYLTLIAKQQLLSDDEIHFGERTVLERVRQALDIDEQSARDLMIEADIGAERPDDNTRTLIEIIRPELNDLVREISRGLVYATNENGGSDDTGVYLIGSIARWKGMDQLLTSILKHPIQTVPNPLGAFVSSAGSETGMAIGRPELAVAAGLALRDFHNG